MSTHSLTLNLQFRRNSEQLISVEQQLQEIFELAKFISNWSPLLTQWYRPSSTTREDALKYKAFDSNGPTESMISLEKEEHSESETVRILSVWNGAKTSSEGVTIRSVNTIGGRPDNIELSFRSKPEITDWHQGVELIRHAITIWPALFASFNPFFYSEKCVFQNSPGVGWMLYIPETLTVQQVPEARSLEPVLDQNKQQIGTIVVSVIDEQFSDEKPEHVDISNAIEIRLADLDLLPRYKNL